MKRLLLLLTVVFTCLSLFSTVAEAKRFGGGGSFGKQRAMPANETRKAPATPSAPATAPAPGGNKWLGPLAGLALGAGLASLFAGSGLNGAMGGILMALLAAAAVTFLLARLRKPQASAVQYAGNNAPRTSADNMQHAASAGSGSALAAPGGNIPHDFPVESFLRNGKATFIRLQAANDRMDLDDIREYTTPEMFAEISLQMQERGDAPQKTDVIAIQAVLLEVATDDDYSIASVRFSGQLRENRGESKSVDEIWHVQKNLRAKNAMWLLAGIQQVTLH